MTSEKKIKLIKKIIPLFSALIFCFFSLFQLYSGINSVLSIIILVTELLSFVFSIFLIFFPKQYYFYAIFAFIYSILFALFNEYSFLMILSASITIVYCWNQGFFHKHKLISAILCSSYFIGLFLLRIFLFKETFLENFIKLLPFLLIISVLLLFVLNSYTLHVGLKNKKIIDLSELPFSDRKKNICISLLSNKTYKDIAEELITSESVVKKEAVEIFQYFEVCSKYAFLSKFSDFTFKLNNKTYKYEQYISNE